jgi:hypothetical protein
MSHSAHVQAYNQAINDGSLYALRSSQFDIAQSHALVATQCANEAVESYGYGSEVVTFALSQMSKYGRVADSHLSILIALALKA